MTDDLAAILEEAFRREWPALVAAAARITGDLGRAEEVAQDGLVNALDRWPFSGVPDRPGAWLMAATRNRARNRVRDDLRARDRERVATAEVVDDTAGIDEAGIEDDVLRLIFLCCHPTLASEGRVALTLRLIGGLSTAEIARAFLVPKPTMAQRLTRAKSALAAEATAFATLDQAEWGQRLPDVLGVVYLIFNEGYAAASGPVLTRPQLCDESRRLAGLLATLLADEPEVHGLHALVLLQSARVGTRVDDHGELVLLEEQERTRWDPTLIEQGLAAIERSLRLSTPGPFTLQAMIVACHVRAASWADTDWRGIIALYDQLAVLEPSPVVALNRAVAVSMLSLNDASQALDALTDELDHYAPFHAARADVLRRLGRTADALVAYRQAAAFDLNEPEHRFLIRRADECADLLEHARQDTTLTERNRSWPTPSTPSPSTAPKPKSSTSSPTAPTTDCGATA